MQYVPDDKKEEIRRKICEDCKYNNGEEQLACCYCQEGSLFEEKEKKKIPRGNRRKAPIIDCEDRFKCDGGNPVTGCGM